MGCHRSHKGPRIWELGLECLIKVMVTHQARTRHGYPSTKRRRGVLGGTRYSLGAVSCSGR